MSAYSRSFLSVCSLAGIVATERQWSKWRNEKGSAYSWFLANGDGEIHVGVYPSVPLFSAQVA